MGKAEAVSQRALDEGYEPEDVSVRGILIVIAGSLAILVLIGWALWGMVDLFVANRKEPTPTAVEQMRIATPPPRLQTAPDRDLAALRAREEDTLAHFAWVDRSARDRADPDRAGDGPALPARVAAAGPARGAGSAARAEPPGAASAPGETPSAPTVPPPVPRTSSQETGPSQATPHGGLR